VGISLIGSHISYIFISSVKIIPLIVKNIADI